MVIHIDDLNRTHALFLRIIDLIESRLRPELAKKDIKNIKIAINTEEYIFHQIYTFSRSYEKIFRELIKIEKDKIK